MGHGVAAYARTLRKGTNRYESSLLFAKSKINPTKDISVPCLELVAALLCAKITDMLGEELDFLKNQIFCYSDSETTLWWLAKKPNSLLPFVANRVHKIQEFGYVFQYMSMQVNPADVASCGCAPHALKRTLRTQAPNFLRLSREDSHFAEEIKNLKPGQNIPRHSKLLPLNPQLDQKGVLRVHGRLVEAPLLEFEMFPIILPKGYGFVSSLILKTQLDNQHSPVDWTHFHLRQQYWIMSSRLQIKSVLRKCLKCQKSNARRGQQIMAPLPIIRLKYSPSFTKVGVDYAAKIQVKMIIRARTSHPCYMVIFTCLITRAVHTELVLSNEAEAFLLALRRMMSVRGTPSHLYTDNELYFKKADKELKETIALNNEIIMDAAYKYEFQWSYSTELHSAGGGIWERAVKLIKVPLRKLIGKSEVMTYVDFLTLMKDAEVK